MFRITNSQANTNKKPHFTPVRMAITQKTKKKKIINSDEEIEEEVRMQISTIILGDSMEIPQRSETKS